jgi:hypothetical protein
MGEGFGGVDENAPVEAAVELRFPRRHEDELAVVGPLAAASPLPIPNRSRPVKGLVSKGLKPLPFLFKLSSTIMQQPDCRQG